MSGNKAVSPKATAAPKNLTLDAEAVTTMQALIVIENLFINLFANRGTSYAASYSAKQSTDKSASNTANGYPYWATDHA